MMSHKKYRASPTVRRNPVFFSGLLRLLDDLEAEITQGQLTCSTISFTLQKFTVLTESNSKLLLQYCFQFSGWDHGSFLESDNKTAVEF